MRIICISRGSFSFGSLLAERLAAKLGFACIGREEVTDLATAHGIPVGKIEMQIVKRKPLSEDQTIEVDRYKAFVTAMLCDRALRQNVVYHGRTGHLVLPGVPHLLRIKAIAAMEERLAMAMQRMNLTRDKAKRYVDEVNDDINRWVRTLYNVQWDNPSLYDITINAANLSVENAASALVQMAQLPDFQSTPASQQALEDLLLAARCRLAIGDDPRTREIKTAVEAARGTVSVTYPPRQAAQAAAISEVLRPVEGVKSLTCTVATTSILFIQERFDPDAEPFSHLVEVAEKWNASVTLLRLAAGDAGETAAHNDPPPALPVPSGDDGGILDDTAGPGDCEESGCGLPETMQRLVQVGRAGAAHTVHGGAQGLTRSLSRTERYSLIVVGDVFLARMGALRKRLKRDLMGVLADHLRVPVIGTEDLKARYLFGPAQWLSLAASAAASVLVYMGVFTHQESLLRFVTQPGTLNRIAAASAIGAFVPLAALAIGGVAHNVFKLFKLE